MTAKLDLTGPTARAATIATAPHGLAHLDAANVRVVITSDGKRVSIKVGDLELSCRGPITGAAKPPNPSKRGAKLLKSDEIKSDEVLVAEGPQMGETHWDAVYSQGEKLMAVRYRKFRGQVDWDSIQEPRAVIAIGNRDYLDERPQRPG